MKRYRPLVFFGVALVLGSGDQRLGLFLAAERKEPVDGGTDSAHSRTCRWSSPMPILPGGPSSRPKWCSYRNSRLGSVRKGISQCGCHQGSGAHGGCQAERECSRIQIGAGGGDDWRRGGSDGSSTSVRCQSRSMMSSASQASSSRPIEWTSWSQSSRTPASREIRCPR